MVKFRLPGAGPMTTASFYNRQMVFDLRYNLDCV